MFSTIDYEMSADAAFVRICDNLHFERDYCVDKEEDLIVEASVKNHLVSYVIKLKPMF